MLAVIIILSLLQPISVLLGAWICHRASQRQSPIPKFGGRKIDVVADADGDRNHSPTRIPVKRS